LSVSLYIISATTAFVAIDAFITWGLSVEVGSLTAIDVAVVTNQSQTGNLVAEESPVAESVVVVPGSTQSPAY
jgi:hypothetical protein